MIDRSEGTFQGVGKLELYYQSWQPQGNVRAILVMVHGLGGHGSKYNNIVQHFIPKQYAIYTFDMRGHGHSPGQRGYINSWDEFREDLRTFLDLVQTQQPKCPIFLVGHSLGSVVVLDYVLRYPQEAAVLQGVITLAPSLGKVGVPKVKLLIGQLMSRIWPRFSLNTGLDLAAGARDEKVLAAYAQDKLRHTLGTARLATEFLDTVAWVNNHAAEWQLPLLILHGGADRVTLPESSKVFYEQVTFADKTRIEYPEAYHELQDDLNYQEVLSDLETWLEQHLLTETKVIG
ncbi:lysophospholipase [Nostoc sp. FACHB-152]|uniref:alpha/beta hydrolase n=1 Tax=unclassified Nostoc TaxID=2593658 RepID=UPI001689FFEB|nr:MULTISPECIES: alpha/beta hydrolase [unclassified Nostoc]MBD2446687.1 lysophospholipase [Nostoc sp. FACHB-152]MBD2466535.1 lysophospholipase [Nostoc sp. FACHB-145]